MTPEFRKFLLTLVAGSALTAVGGLAEASSAAAEGVVRRPAVAGPRAAVRPRAVRTAAARPLTIRRRAVGAVDVVGGPGYWGDDYLVRQHSWNDPRLYYWGPFRTGGEVFYGDEAGNPITRGNAGLGQIAGYGPARGGFGGPHFDAVGGFHQGPGPDYQIDNDYASGSLSRPDYGGIVPRYPSVQAQVANLNAGVVSGPVSEGVASGRGAARPTASLASFEQAKSEFAAPMKRQAPIEAGFANGGLNSIGMGDDAF